MSIVSKPNRASAMLFPAPRALRVQPGTVRLPATISLRGEPVPSWLRQRLALACATADVRLVEGCPQAISTALSEKGFSGIKNASLRAEAYRLSLDPRGNATVTSPTPVGLRAGLLTMVQLLDAVGSGARLSPLVIQDHPTFAVRGIQIDMAREYFPSPSLLRGLIERAAALKFNTIWLYLENHFHAPGLEDLSPPGGLTPAQARSLSAYAAARGVDLVPATNVLSHMEGWFRLERYAGMADGRQLSYPVLTHPDAWPLVRSYLDALATAFPSRNIHAGLDELLFCGTHPDAAAAIKTCGKAEYFAAFAVKVIHHLQTVHHKTVWMWDDMVMGKNVYRAEGLNDAYRDALDRIPRDVVMSHWYYWTDSDGKHSPILKRVVDSGRPFVVNPSALAFASDAGSLRQTWANQSYMAGCGVKHGALGFVNTHWESRYGSVFMAAWPALVLGAGLAWGGRARLDPRYLDAFSFQLTGSTRGLAPFLKTVDAIQDLLERAGVGPAMLRSLLFLDGPQALWRQTTMGLTPAARRRLRTLLAALRRHHASVGPRDPLLKTSLAFVPRLFEVGLATVEGFDRARAAYHRAARLERVPAGRRAFYKALGDSVRALGGISHALQALRRDLLMLTRHTGHTPYDAYAIGAWIGALAKLKRLVRAAAREGTGLPHFEKLLSLPRCYYESNLAQLRIQNTYHVWHSAKTAAPPRERP